MDGYRTAQAQRLTGLSTRQLVYWQSTGLYCPSVRRGRSGEATLYSFEDLIALRGLRELKSKGVSTQVLRVIADGLRDFSKGSNPWQGVYLVSNGRDVQMIGDAGQLLSLLESPGNFALDLGKLEIEVTALARSVAMVSVA